jgi:thioredoxin 1|tara:strand:+ start:22215 stop:22706 length:492 start_codon:yes stop_codon:yes gene_type:complete
MSLIIRLIILGVVIMGCCGGSCHGDRNLDEYISLSGKSALLSKQEDDSEDKEVKYKEGDVIVMQFSAVWCGPCRALKASIKSDAEIQNYFKKETKGYFIVDVDDKDKTSAAWVKKAKPSSIPLVVLYKREKDSWNEVSRFTGSKPPSAVLKWLKEKNKKSPVK